MPPARSTKTSRDGTAAPEDVNPASLLWAYQLKREHGFLLARMTDLEAMHQKYDARIKTTETIAGDMKAATEEIKHISASIKSLGKETKELREWLAELDHEKQEIVKDSKAKMTRAEEGILALESRCENIEATLQQSAVEHRSVADKVADLEKKIHEQGKTAAKLVKKNDPSEVKVLMLRLDAIEALRMEEVRKSELLFQRVLSLEKANADLQSHCRKIPGETLSLERRLNADIIRGRNAPQIMNGREDSPDMFEMSNWSGASSRSLVKVPATPPPKTPSGRAKVSFVRFNIGDAPPKHSRYGHPIEDSPSIHAQVRKATRTRPRPSQHEAQIVSTQLATQTQPQALYPHTTEGQTNKREKAGKDEINGANAGKKRKDPPYGRRETRSQTKKQKKGIDQDVTTEAELRKPSPPAPKARQNKERIKTTKPLQLNPGLSNRKMGCQPNTPLKGKQAKRRKRQISQPVDTETFMLIAG